MIHHLESTKRPFLGKKVAKASWSPLSVSSGFDSVDVWFDDGTGMRVQVEGDCCSTSIFYEIVFPSEVVGGEIVDIEEGCDRRSEDQNPEVDPEEIAKAKVSKLSPDFYFEEQSIWNVAIRTTKGSILLRHLNSSNGFYDGFTSFFPITHDPTYPPSN